MRPISIWLFSFLGITAANAALAVPREIRVIVALADNDHQGIVKTSKALGDGDGAKGYKAAAAAYAKYQKIGIKPATALFAPQR